MSGTTGGPFVLLDRRAKQRLVITDAAEAAVLGELVVRLVQPEEQARWDQLVIENHYLKSATMVGEQLRYVDLDWFRGTAYQKSMPNDLTRRGGRVRTGTFAQQRLTPPSPHLGHGAHETAASSPHTDRFAHLP